mmetsp:Transcript_20709/g.23779  ORF Transcript_20709/g.23779 Transcript_20709/m.23779 type:complete len:91 (-) Transcript_20709:355-627(-)
MHSVSTGDPKKTLSGDDVKNMNILDLVVDCRRKYKALRKNISWDVINKNMVTGIRIMCINKWNHICRERGESNAVVAGYRGNRQLSILQA